MTSIESIMHENVLTAEPEEMVDVVVRRMCSAGVGAVVIVEDGRLRALFTERDLLTRVVGDGRDPGSTRVIEVATEQVISVPRDASIRHCADALRKRKSRHLPVTEDGRPVGMVSGRDFFDIVAGKLEGLIEHSGYGKKLEEGQDPYDHLGGSYGR
jgi:CBS domain-containing protein